jgi:hypothetical protein
MAKLDLNKTKSVCGGYGAIWEGWGRPGRGGGCPTTLGHAPMGLHLIHGPLGRIRWRSTWNRLTSGQWFDNCDRHREDMDMSLDPYAILLHPHSREYLNAPIWLRMRPWRPSQVGVFLQSESSLRESFSLSVLTMIPNQKKSACVSTI